MATSEDISNSNNGNSMEIKNDVLDTTFEQLNRNVDLCTQQKTNNKESAEPVEFVSNSKNELSVKQEVVVTDKYCCDPCSFDEETRQAQGFCVVCIEYLCRDCLRDHRRNKTTRQHNILNDANIPENAKWFKNLAETVLCPSHSDKEVEYRCEDHKEYICLVCVARSHRKCEHVEAIIQEENSNSCIKEATETLEKVISLQQNIGLVKSNRESNIQCLREEEITITGQRELLIAQINERLVQLDTISRKEAETLVESKILQLTDDITETIKNEKDQIENAALIETAMKYGTPKQIKVVTSQILENLDKSKKQIENQKNKKELHLGFTPNSSHKKIESLGVLKVEQYTSKANESNTKQNTNEDMENDNSTESVDFSSTSESIDGNDQSDIEQNTSMIHDAGIQKKYQSGYQETQVVNEPNKNELPLMERKLIGCHSVRDERDKRCNINGIVILPDGRLVFMDNCNSKIKLFDKDFGFVTELSLTSKPYAMCFLRDREIAVTFVDLKRVTIYIVGNNSVHEERSFATKLYGRGVAKFGGNVAVLFSNENGNTDVNSTTDAIEIQVRDDKNGKILRTIDKKKVKKSHINLLNPKGLLCVNENEILIAECENLKCFDTNGIQKWLYKTHRNYLLEGINGLAIDRDGNFLVCGTSSNNVHQISGTNFRTNRIIIPDIERPISIAYDAQNERLLVACENRDFIQIYKFV